MNKSFLHFVALYLNLTYLIIFQSWACSIVELWKIIKCGKNLLKNKATHLNFWILYRKKKSIFKIISLYTLSPIELYYYFLSLGQEARRVLQQRTQKDIVLLLQYYMGAALWCEYIFFIQTDGLVLLWPTLHYFRGDFSW